MQYYEQARHIGVRLASAVCLACIATIAQATPINIAVSLSGLPAANGGITALALPSRDIGRTSVDLNAGTPGGEVAISVNTPANQGIVSGSRAGLYAAPVSGGSAASPSYWMAPYFSTGLGTITLNFEQAQSYFGLLWGSIDGGATYNYIQFNEVSRGKTTTVATVTANDVYAATGSQLPSGSQGYGGSYYTLLNDLDGTFNQIVLGSTVVSFEAGDFQYADARVSLQAVPEPAGIVSLAAGLAGMAALRRKRANG